jgi:ribosomal protein S15P/S13E
MKGHILMNNEDFHGLRRQLVKIISQINSVANFEGKKNK